MTDQDENRPLSRREIRLREMAAAGGSDAAAAEPAPAIAEAPAFAAADAAPAFEVEISPFDEDGRQRSRREMRELRDQAIAAMQAEAGEPAGTEAEVPAAVEAEVAGEPFSFDALLQDAAEEVAAEEVAAVEAAEPVAEADEVLVEAVAVSVEADEASVEAAEVSVEAVAEPVAANSFFAAPAAAEEPAEPIAETVAIEVEEVAEAPSFFDLVAPAASEEVEVEIAPEVAFQAEQAAEPASDSASNDADDSASEATGAASLPSGFDSPVSATTAPVSQGYSFPDIAPLDEGLSVFDDPSVQMMGGSKRQQPAASDNRGFDDLISRAVAQESATTSTNTSALILPSMPDSDGLTGPLGETGELFITGSYDLPKSLGETGGHTSLQDAGDVEALDELGFVEATPTGMMAPVSASRAVSARGVQGPVVAEATKDKSKLPVVLIATGGVLVLGAVGLIIWAAASGLFG